MDGCHAFLKSHGVDGFEEVPDTLFGEQNARIAANAGEDNVEEILVDGFFCSRVRAFETAVAQRVCDVVDNGNRVLGLL